MSPESIEQIRGLRQRIVKGEPINNILKSGLTHENILSEVEGMVDDKFAFNRLQDIVSAALSLDTPTEEERKIYASFKQYLAMARAASGDEYDV